VQPMANELLQNRLWKEPKPSLQSNKKSPVYAGFF